MLSLSKHDANYFWSSLTGYVWHLPGLLASTGDRNWNSPTSWIPARWPEWHCRFATIRNLPRR